MDENLLDVKLETFDEESRGSESHLKSDGKVIMEVIEQAEEETEEDDKLINCRSCTSQFTTREEMRVHQETLDSCEFCSLEVIHSDIKQHWEEVHPSERSSRFKCNPCQKYFKDNTTLLWHKKTQHEKKCKMYKCAECDFTSPYSDSVRRHHLGKHQGDEARRFKCSVCDYASKHKSALKVHMSKVNFITH